MTITPPLWGVLLAFLVVFVLLFRAAMKEETRMEQEQLARYRHLTDDEIDYDQ